MKKDDANPLDDSLPMSARFRDRVVEFSSEFPNRAFPDVERLGEISVQRYLSELFCRLEMQGEFDWDKLITFISRESLPVTREFLVDSPNFNIDKLLRSIGIAERTGYVFWIPDRFAELEIYEIDYLRLGEVIGDFWHPDDDIVFCSKPGDWLLLCWHYDGFFSFWKKDANPNVSSGYSPEAVT